jgi:hypothetical protein
VNWNELDEDHIELRGSDMNVIELLSKLWALSSGIMRPECERGLNSAEINNACRYDSTPQYLFMACCFRNYTDCSKSWTTDENHLFQRHHIDSADVTPL